MSTNVEVPALGESVTEAILIKRLKADGDVVTVAEPICELETDKANVDLPAPVAGVVRWAKEEGDTVHVGETIARIDAGGAGVTAAKPAAPAAKAAAASPAKPASPPPPAAKANKNNEDLSPAVRRLVEENHLDPAGITPTGPGGRLTKEDVVAHVERSKSTPAPPAAPRSEPAPAPAPQPARPITSEAMPAVTAKPAPTGREQLAFDTDGTKRIPLSKIRKRIAENLLRAQQTAAILTTFNEIDLHQVMELRSKFKERFEKVHGVGLGFMSFFARAVVLALGEFPRVNAFLEGDEIVYHQFVHLGIAVSTDRGLAVPVLRNVESMSFSRIESEIKRLANATREGKLGLEELSGGTFTITNGGVFGSLLSTPILNPPQSGILGMHAIQKRPVVVNDKIEIRPMMYVALSYDHRLVDGRESVSFLVRLKEYLEDPARLMLEI
ncbi:MAG: 2-oxoglutarate dehydrogenase complex dihydrolipoyllysine-residue succinyltransferase [Phycisphaerales bacterium]|nr:2-oxoglutarate dehydrogenase complex dihydrolipoyllysine-residue succinyltransferase [Phycisphaerales bacterium]